MKRDSLTQRIASACVLGALILWFVGMVACATTQQLLIKADMAYATAVFALDDAEYAACHPVVALTPTACADLDGKVGQALLDVQSVTRAIQLAPTTVPKDLPSLLGDLNSVQSVLLQLQQIPLVTSLASKTADANAKAVALLSHLLGGK